MSGPVEQAEYEGARDSVCLVLALYSEWIDAEERRAQPDGDLIYRLVSERTAYGRKLNELDLADAAGVRRISEEATAFYLTAVSPEEEK